MDYKGYKIEQSKGHGQSVKGNKKTATMRVIDDLGNAFLIKKQHSFPVNDTDKREKAIEKCIKYIDDNLLCKECGNNKPMQGVDTCQWCVLSDISYE